MDTDRILIKRLISYFPDDIWMWNPEEPIHLDDITNALSMGDINEIADCYGDVSNHPVVNQQSRNWHIGRVIYLIHHPNEIMNIDLDNQCVDGYILPQPIIVDGHHRFMAAVWLFYHKQLSEIECIYSGRLDLLNYLKGLSDVRPE